MLFNIYIEMSEENDLLLTPPSSIHRSPLPTNLFSVSTMTSAVLSYLVSLLMICGGIVPYIPQYLAIKRADNAEGFSMYICLALLVANILRILFWFGKHFELTLLIQSIVMNIAMLAMIELCIRTRHRNTIIPHKTRYFLDLNFRYFWDWTDFISYIECLATFTVIAGVSTWLLNDCKVYVETIGFIALITEAILGMPQLIKNYNKKSTAGMSAKMVYLWLVGDIFKTTYFIVKMAPAQFWACGFIQISVDLVILGQVFIYRSQYSKVKLYRN